MEALLFSAAMIFAAELGDKSQLMALTFTTRYKARTILIGLSVSTLAMSLLSTLAGRFFSELIDADVLRIIAGFAFLVFAGLSMLPPENKAEKIQAKKIGGKTALVTVAGTFALAEFGDKTMLATMTLATQHPWYLIWIGSSIGMIASASLAVWAGHTAIKRIPPWVVRYVAAGMFTVVGIMILIG